ncbi:hypothetical protein VNI00_009116 [Paramarasmius palmivorus]|uniref:Glycoside hydrolase family 76 protein n=1 Tax=Paramarasmius palmivorus TaxID=297713 RepID=A0AAW0CS06_9AGAR
MTTNETYLSAAITTIQFLLGRMQLEDSGLFADSISANEQDQCKMDTNPTGYGNALIMQGMSIFNSVKPSTGYNEIMKDLVVRVTTNPDWHNGAGILSLDYDADVTPLYLPRGLVQVYNATTDTDFRKYISAYLSTQYNAVMENPRNDPSVARVQIAFLLAATVISPANSSETVVPDPSSPLTPTPERTASETPTITVLVAPILGGVLGGLAFVAILVLVVLYRRRRKNAAPITPVFDSSDIVAASTQDLFQTQILPRQRIYRRNPDVKRSEKWDAPPDYATLPG